MAKFELLTCIHDQRIHHICDEINDCYFDDQKATDADWANTDQTYQWFDKNDSIFTAAFFNSEPVGFYEVLPLTQEATENFVKNGVTENQITADHIVTGYQDCPAYGAYISGIAVKNGLGSTLRAQCSVALVAGLLHDILYRYNKNTLRWIITNPVTSTGLAMTKNFGFTALNPLSTPFEDTFLIEVTPVWRQEWFSKQSIYSMRHLASYKKAA